MSRTLVFGRNGQVASEIGILKGGDSSFVFAGKDEINVLDSSALRQFISKIKPSAVINCMAYTAVDKAESEREACFALNRDFPSSLAKLSSELNFHLVHFSTDYVFGGNGTSPYSETDPVDPVNTYGLSKLEGEREIERHSSSATIVRTSWVYSRFGHNFVKTMLRVANDGKPLRVVSDQVGCPTWAGDLARLAVEHLRNRPSGVEYLNFSGEGHTSWYGFAEEIFKTWSMDYPVTAISTADFPTPAKRPKYSVLSKRKIASELGVRVPDWRESLKECFKSWEQK